MRETKSKEIGKRGFTYNVTQFGARKGGRIALRLLKILGSAAGTAMQEGGESDDGFDLKVVGKMVENLSSILTEADYDYLCDEFMKVSSVTGGKYEHNTMPLHADGVFDLHFAGEYIELGEWIAFCVEVNFGGFLGEGGLLKKASKVVAKPPPDSPEARSEKPSVLTSPNTSAPSGPSGA